MSAWTTKLNGQNDTEAVRWSAGHTSGAHMMESGSPGHVEEGGAATASTCESNSLRPGQIPGPVPSPYS